MVFRWFSGEIKKKKPSQFIIDKKKPHPTWHDLRNWDRGWDTILGQGKRAESDGMNN